ncbi:MAG TPA: hypothetical protein PKI64_08805, partial [Kiritimatiellia bacterium]|nr:hypothetical protein [Kiritimatiellia bacterium]HOU59800.1 hypothetical protein [Kiritimatiellia bacterium]HQK45310.1 hypothetical protein [Kiritimatiellia bacterium]HQM24129.1 hypothetical protein [Kiritimatiellia bacterium]
DLTAPIEGLEWSQTFQPFTAGRFHSSTIPALQKPDKNRHGAMRNSGFPFLLFCISRFPTWFFRSRRRYNGGLHQIRTSYLQARVAPPGGRLFRAMNCPVY